MPDRSHEIIHIARERQSPDTRRKNRDDEKFWKLVLIAGFAISAWVTFYYLFSWLWEVL